MNTKLTGLPHPSVWGSAISVISTNRTLVGGHKLVWSVLARYNLRSSASTVRRHCLWQIPEKMRDNGTELTIWLEPLQLKRKPLSRTSLDQPIHRQPANTNELAQSRSIEMPQGACRHERNEYLSFIPPRFGDCNTAMANWYTLHNSMKKFGPPIPI